MLLSIVYYVVLLIHLYPIAYALAVRLPEFTAYVRSSTQGKIVCVIYTASLVHTLYELLFGQIFELSTVLLLVGEFAVVFFIAKMSKITLDPRYSLTGVEMTGKTVLVTGTLFSNILIYLSRRQFRQWLLRCL
jgi:hypothetical protein